MAAKGSRRGRGRGSGPETGPESEPATSPEADFPARDDGAVEDVSAVEADAEDFPTLQGREEAEVAAATIEPAEPSEPIGPEEPRERATWRASHLIVGGLAVVLALDVVAGVLIYATTSDPDRLGQLAQRLDAFSTQADGQADRLGAAEDAIAGLRSELGQATTAFSELQSAAEANRENLDRLAQGFEDLRNSAAVPADGAAAGELRDSIEALDGRVASLEQGSGLDDLTGRIARLEEEIAGLRDQAAERVEQSDSASALGQAYAALAERIAAGAPFAEELEAVAAELPSAPGLEVLRPLAGNGVPTLSDLRARLAEIAGQTPPAERDDTAAADADGVWQTMRQRLQGMVTVRRSDEADWAAVLARADEALERDDLDAAIAAVEAAGDAAPGEIADWLADARARRDAQAALNEVSDAVLRQVAGRQ